MFPEWCQLFPECSLIEGRGVRGTRAVEAGEVLLVQRALMPNDFDVDEQK